MSDHACHALLCKKAVPPRLFMCLPHWRRLPKKHKDAISAMYRSGQEIDKQPSPEYLVAQADAVLAMGLLDGVDAAQLRSQRAWLEVCKRRVANETQPVSANAQDEPVSAVATDDERLQKLYVGAMGFVLRNAMQKKDADKIAWSPTIASLPRSCIDELRTLLRTVESPARSKPVATHRITREQFVRIWNAATTYDDARCKDALAAAGITVE